MVRTKVEISDPSLTRSETIERLRHGDLTLLDLFGSDLKEQIEKGNLPYYLQEVHLELSSNKAPTNIKPELSPLLNLKLDEAKTQFEILYLKYHLQKHSNKIPEMAKALGLKQSTLRTKFRRIRKSQK